MSLLSRVLDATIVLSFDRSGFRRHAASFRPEDLQVDLTGRVAVVTGANSGIGKATSRALAERGAEVFLLCRSEERGRAALRALREATGSRRLRLVTVDVAEPDSVRAGVGSGTLRVGARSSPTRRDDTLSWLRHCVMRRPSVSRVRETRTHGLKGGNRNPGSQEHRA
jgi:hypothetical protein